MDRYGQEWHEVHTGGGCMAHETSPAIPGGCRIGATDGDAALGFSVLIGFCADDECEGTVLADTGDYYTDVPDTDTVRAALSSWLSDPTAVCDRCLSFHNH